MLKSQDFKKNVPAEIEKVATSDFNDAYYVLRNFNWNISLRLYEKSFVSPGVKFSQLFPERISTCVYIVSTRTKTHYDPLEILHIE